MSAEDAVHFFQALGDETRLRLVSQLRTGERTVGELVTALGCPQPKVSRHLKVLREAGLVMDRRDGRNVTYALTTRLSWPLAAREWIERLDAGLVSIELHPGSPDPEVLFRPKRVERTERTKPAAERKTAREALRPRRSELETHLL